MNSKHRNWRNMRWLIVVLLATALTGSGLAAKKGPPSPQELRTGGERPLSVLLLRIILEVDGQPGAAFPSGSTGDGVTIGLSDFSTGVSAKPVAVRFLSDETRLDGWVYLVLEPGPRYLATREPRSQNAFDYEARWKTCPHWSLEIPANSRLVYGGTLFLPGAGRWMMFGPRAMVEFDSSRLEVRDESAEAEAICRKWFPDLLPMSVQLAEEHRPGDTMIIETPEDAKNHPPRKP